MDQLLWRLAVCAAATVLLGTDCTAQAEMQQSVATERNTQLTVYELRHVVLHTDLSAGAATAVVKQIETTLQFAARHWGRSPRGSFDCYVAANVASWPDDALPHPLARIWIGGIGGATVGGKAGRRGERSPTTVYASTTPGVVPHEIIHAYCMETFRATGPDWYKEGIAEVVAFGTGREQGVDCPQIVITSLRKGPPQTVGQIVTAGQFTHSTRRSLSVMLANRIDLDRHVPLSDWTAGDKDRLVEMREAYHWSWALCHFLLHNPNYTRRFRQLEESYLTDGRESFEHTFLPVLRELQFEFAHFAAHVDIGYRADLCSWDWKKPFRTLASDEKVRCCVHARRGFQPAGLAVQAGQSYAYETSGQWMTASEGKEAVDADGDDAGAGALVGILLTGSELTDPFVLGTRGTFNAKQTGRLYLRCQDEWGQLADNSGEVRVQLERTR